MAYVSWYLIQYFVLSSVLFWKLKNWGFFRSWKSSDIQGNFVQSSWKSHGSLHKVTSFLAHSYFHYSLHLILFSFLLYSCVWKLNVRCLGGMSQRFFVLYRESFGKKPWQVWSGVTLICVIYHHLSFLTVEGELPHTPGSPLPQRGPETQRRSRDQAGGPQPR